MKGFLLILLLCNVFQVSAQYKKLNATEEKEYGLYYSSDMNSIYPLAQLEKEEIVLSIKLLNNVSPDVYVVVFSIYQLASNIKNLDQLMSDRINAFRMALAEIGLNEQYVYIENMGINPLYSKEKSQKRFSKINNEQPYAIEGQKNVQIHFENYELLDQIIQIAAQYEIYDLLELNYIKKDPTSVFDELRSKGLANLDKQIKEYEKKLGLTINRNVAVIAEDRKVSQPNDRISVFRAQQLATLDKVPEKGKEQQFSQASLKQHELIDLSDFDVVLQAENFKSSMQFMMEIKMSVKVKDTYKSEVEYIWITPDGERVPIDFKK